MSDFLPAMVDISILAGAFLLVWNLDVRKVHNARRLRVPEHEQTEDVFMAQTEEAGPS